ncbi:MAG: HAMP domain-containing protein [Chloroflexi bacterium]|nr:HAMP domain-containing protein [Chloroflexota bacterium]
MRLNNLRVRLVVWTVAFEAVLLLVFGALLILAIQSTQSSQIDEALRLGASQLNAVVDIQAGRYVIQPTDKSALSAQGIYAWILTPEGVVANSVGDVGSGLPPLPLSNLDQVSDQPLPNGETGRFLVTYLSEGSHNLGTLVLAMSLRDSQQLIREIVLGLAIAMPVILFLSGAGGLFLANRALSPVATITRTARSITAADLSRRLAIDVPDDEIGQLAATLNAMLARLEQSFERERQLTADVSHELRTPLGLLKTQLSLARSRPRDNAVLLQMIADMEEDVDRMTRLTEQMLILARIEQDDAVERDVVDLKNVLRGVVEPVQEQAAEQEIEVALGAFPESALRVMGNEERLIQVFLSLLDNAVKYAGTHGRVAVEARCDNQSIVVSIFNTGEAIAPEHLPHLFERFYRADSARSRETGGFGLGLAIAAAIVKAHDGEIHVSSQASVGTTVTVTLPTLNQI